MCIHTDIKCVLSIWSIFGRPRGIPFRISRRIGSVRNTYTQGKNSENTMRKGICVYVYIHRYTTITFSIFGRSTGVPSKYRDASAAYKTPIEREEQ